MDSEQNLITFEQPINEHVRLCLRMEHVFEQLEHSIYGDMPWESRIAVNQILHLMVLTERPDLKSKILQLLKQCRQFYAHLNESPQVDHEVLDEVLQRVDHGVERLTATDGRIGESIRESDLLSRIRMQSANPAGVVPFNCPEYYLWLSQSAARRQQDLERWAGAFDELKEVNRLLLELIRQCGTTEYKHAENGFYQERLDTHVPNQLVSVRLSQNEGIFPEISVGRQRVSIHFMGLNSDNMRKVEGTVPFELTFYRLG